MHNPLKKSHEDEVFFDPNTDARIACHKTQPSYLDENGFKALVSQYKLDATHDPDMRPEKKRHKAEKVLKDDFANVEVRAAILLKRVFEERRRGLETYGIVHEDLSYTHLTKRHLLVLHSINQPCISTSKWQMHILLLNMLEIF